jgi:DHA2 family multidrug resistance protein
MARGYDAVTAHQAALKSIAAMAHTQAMVMSYNDAFLFIGLAIVMVSPCILLLRPKKRAIPTADMGH